MHNLVRFNKNHQHVLGALLTQSENYFCSLLLLIVTADPPLLNMKINGKNKKPSSIDLQQAGNFLINPRTLRYHPLVVGNCNLRALNCLDCNSWKTSTQHCTSSLDLDPDEHTQFKTVYWQTALVNEEHSEWLTGASANRQQPVERLIRLYGPDVPLRTDNWTPERSVHEMKDLNGHK